MAASLRGAADAEEPTWRNAGVRPAFLIRADIPGAPGGLTDGSRCWASDKPLGAWAGVHKPVTVYPCRQTGKAEAGQQYRAKLAAASARRISFKLRRKRVANAIKFPRG